MTCHRSISKFYIVLYSLVVFLIQLGRSSQQCSREGSRLVRKVLDLKFYPVFESYGVEINEDCPFVRTRDLYLAQEEHKSYEHTSRWRCYVCGKAFYNEDFLDLHMENKHEEILIKEESSPVCLADYCQLFRCEAAVRRNRRNKHFWNKALCNADNMVKLRRKCMSLVKSCVPPGENSVAHKNIYNEIIEGTCLLINCKDYWQPLEYELSPYEILYYLAITPLLIMAFGVYYYNIWDQYFGENGDIRATVAVTEERQSNEKHIELPNIRKRYWSNSRFT